MAVAIQAGLDRSVRVRRSLFSTSNELAALNRVPTIYELRSFVDVGGLVSYGADIEDIWRRAATYADKILHGARPAGLPIEQPTKFELCGQFARSKSAWPYYSVLYPDTR